MLLRQPTELPYNSATVTALKQRCITPFRYTDGMTARPFVELTIPPHKGELDAWGKDSRGQWWGLVTWYEDVVQPKQMSRRSVLPCSGWAVRAPP